MIYAVMPSPERENDADKISTSYLEMMKRNCLKESSFNCNRLKMLKKIFANISANMSGQLESHICLVGAF